MEWTQKDAQKFLDNEECRQYRPRVRYGSDIETVPTWGKRYYLVSKPNLGKGMVSVDNDGRAAWVVTPGDFTEVLFMADSLEKGVVAVTHFVQEEKRPLHFLYDTNKLCVISNGYDEIQFKQWCTALRVWKDGLSGLITYSGEELVPCIFKNKVPLLWRFDHYSRDYLVPVTTDEGKTGLYSPPEGRVVGILNDGDDPCNGIKVGGR